MLCQIMRINMKNPIFPILCVGAACLPLLGADWPQYRGPNHDGASPEKIPTQWPATGLRQVWKLPLKNGFSSFTLGDGKVYTLVTRDFDGGDQETCLALEAGTGKELWAAPMGVGSSKYDAAGIPERREMTAATERVPPRPTTTAKSMSFPRI